MDLWTVQNRVWLQNAWQQTEYIQCVDLHFIYVYIWIENLKYVKLHKRNFLSYALPLERQYKCVLQLQIMNKDKNYVVFIIYFHKFARRFNVFIWFRCNLTWKRCIMLSSFRMKWILSSVWLMMWVCMFFSYHPHHHH